MIQLFFAFLAGILTIAAPCILPLLPILLGTSVGQSSKTRPLFIVLGFILVFSLAALFLSYLTQVIGLSSNVLRDIAIVVLAVFGFLMIWPKPFELLAAKLSGITTNVSQTLNFMKKSNVQGFLLGMTLGLIWTPCAGPVLGSILTLIATQKNLGTAALLIVAYAIGAGVPMLIIAYGGQFITSKVRFVSRYTNRIQQIFGVMIILLAVAIYLNYDVLIYSYLLGNGTTKSLVEQSVTQQSTPEKIDF